MEYPFDIKTVFTKAKNGEVRTFSVEAKFSPRPEEEDSPLKIFDEKFSRFVFTVINGGVTASANFKVEQLPLLLEKTKIAYEIYLKNSLSAVSTSVSPTSSITFKCGTFKGKTPSQVLIEKGDQGKDILKKQHKWLSDNLSAHPENKEVIDAIDAALSGSAPADSSPTSSFPSIVLCETPAPFVLKRRTKDNGKALTYEYHIVWDTDPGVNMPISVKVRQFYAPFKETSTTLPIPVWRDDKGTSLIEDEVSCKINLTAEQWVDFTDCMEKAKTAFYNLQFADAFKKANDGYEQNRSAASASKERKEKEDDGDKTQTSSVKKEYSIYDVKIESELETTGKDSNGNPTFSSKAKDSNGKVCKIVYMYGLYHRYGETFEKFKNLCRHIGSDKKYVTTRILAEECSYNGERQLRFRGFSK